MKSRSERTFVMVVIGIFLALLFLPVLIGWMEGGDALQFNGVLVNPTDGYTYLAKMRQGYDGSWRVRLLHSAEPGEGAYLYPFYLALGHLARWSGISLVGVFHITRVLAGLWMAIMIFRIFREALPGDGLWKPALVLALFGSGLGWIALLLGEFTSDFWVAEAYPFLTGLVNAHFPFSLACMLTLLWLPVQQGSASGTFQSLKSNWFVIVPLSACLAAISPFGSAIVLLVYAGMIVWEVGPLFRGPSGWVKGVKALSTHKIFSWGMMLAGVTFPILAYEYFVITHDPVYIAWNAQNVTPSPPWWDLLIAFSPVLPFALIGAIRAVKSDQPVLRMLFIWGGATLVILLIPFNLQRRFLAGWYIPMAGLAVLGILEFARIIHKRRQGVLITVIGLSLFTNMIVLATNIQAIRERSPIMFISKAEREAFEWLDSQPEATPLVLTGPDTGLVLPAFTGARVLYGHPFETIRADYWKEQVIAFFQGELSLLEVQELLDDTQVDYLLIGPRDEQYQNPNLQGTVLVFQNLEVKVYQVDEKYP